MPRKQTDPLLPRRYYRGADVPMRVIRRYVRQIAERFQPEKIILFGSYAYGTPHEHSDVDLLVVMPARNELDQAYRISSMLPAPFPIDLLVYKPKALYQSFAEGGTFATQLLTRGKLLYEARNSRVGAKSRRRSLNRAATSRRT